MNDFVYDGAAQRVVFGRGALDRLPAEVARLGLTRVLVLSTAGHAPQATAVGHRLAGHCAAILASARVHTPVTITEQALEVARDAHADGLVALGGGSAIGLSKALARRTDLPQIAVPTTYAGSECTSILGETSGGAKRTVRDPKVLPEVVVYDPVLTHTLTVRQTVASGFNAIAHAIEGLYARGVGDACAPMAGEGLRAFGAALPALVRHPDDGDARAEALYGAWLCGRVLERAPMGLHHKLCHVLGGLFGLPHAETHAILLPHVVAFNAAAAPDAMALAGRSLGMPDAARGLSQLLADSDGVTTLAGLGLSEADLDRAADAVMGEVHANPRAASRDDVRALLGRAHRGDPPQA